MACRNRFKDWLKTFGLLILLGNTFSCETYSQPPKNNNQVTANQTSVNQINVNQPTATEENPKMSQEFIKALQRHDQSIIEKAGQAPSGLPKQIDQAISDLDAEAREMAVELVTRQDSEQAGTFLLRRTADPDVNVATLAADNIGKIINKPKTDDIIAAIRKRDDAFVRGKLYMEAGRRQEKNVLEELRRISGEETDDDAKLKSLAARVKKGGQQEKAEFLEIVRNAEPDDALKIQELLLYIDNPNLAKGMISWLGKTDGIMRIGSDRQNMMARMCDVAIWTAHLLKIKFPFETKHIRNFTDDEIAAARKVLELLPD